MRLNAKRAAPTTAACPVPRKLRMRPWLVLLRHLGLGPGCELRRDVNKGGGIALPLVAELLINPSNDILEAPPLFPLSGGPKLGVAAFCEVHSVSLGGGVAAVNPWIRFSPQVLKGQRQKGTTAPELVHDCLGQFLYLRSTFPNENVDLEKYRKSFATDEKQVNEVPHHPAELIWRKPWSGNNLVESLPKSPPPPRLSAKFPLLQGKDSPQNLKLPTRFHFLMKLKAHLGKLLLEGIQKSRGDMLAATEDVTVVNVRSSDCPA